MAAVSRMVVVLIVLLTTVLLLSVNLQTNLGENIYISVADP
jgi:hypothetical protein